MRLVLKHHIKLKFQDEKNYNRNKGIHLVLNINPNFKLPRWHFIF